MTFLLIVAALVALVWTILVVLALPDFRPGRHLGPSEAEVIADGPSIVALVPAHNEEAGVEATIKDLLAQSYPNLTIIAVNDQSTDRTGALLDALAATPEAAGRLRVIHGVERPSGWVGKTWALAQGVAQAEGEWLLFVDADMRLHREAVATAVEEASRRRAEAISLVPRFACESFWQGSVASALMRAIAQMFPEHRANDPNSRVALAAGGFILVRRSAYDRAGGHAAVRREIVEDIALARCLKAAGARPVLRYAPALAWTPMYGSFGDIWRGLRKNAYAGMNYQLHKFVVGGSAAMVLAWAPIAALTAGVIGTSAPLIVVGLWGWLAQGLATWPTIRYLGIAPVYALAHPAGLSAYVAIATSSVWHHHRGRIHWKGRTYDARSVAAPPDPGV